MAENIIELVQTLVQKAHDLGASDIHIDPQPEVLRVRLRVDGALQDIEPFSKTVQGEIISRIKILANLRTDEHQAAQDGRFQVLIGEKPLDLRVSIMPTYYGENAVLRLLTEKIEGFTLDNLGFSKTDREKIMRAISRPHGMILVTGPTGSGKTTTLYALIKLLNDAQRSIVTLEDPIEYSIAGINQIGINAKTGLTFVNGLRSILRQDPNIIMVGEIRDGETAGLAVNAALTGHLVLSTLHTNDTSSTLPRLLDLKIEPYLIASTVNLIIGQRLIRKKSADGNGYSGRTSINEVLEVTEAIRQAIHQKASASEIKKLAIESGMTPMQEDGQAKVNAGITTLEEILRTNHE